MKLYISKIDNSNTSVSFQYFGSEHMWGLLVSANYSFHLKDVTGEDGDDKLQVGMEAIETAYAQPNIAAKIGADEFRNGNVVSIEFDESRGVDRTKGSIVIEERIRIEEDGALSNLTDLIPSPQDIESFSESFNFNRGENSYSYERSVSLKYRQDAGGEFLNKAYLFLKNVYLNNRPAYGFQEDGISEWGRVDAGLKPVATESIDILNKSVEFSESLETSRIETTANLPFSKSETSKTVLQSDGYKLKNYSFEIRALSEPYEANIIHGITGTLDAVIQANTGAYSQPTLISKGVSEQGNVATLDVEFTNDPRRNNNTNIDYSAAKTESPEGFDSFTFNLTVSSRGKNDVTKFTRNKDYWKSNTNLPYSKIPVLFPEVTSGELFEVDRNVSFEPFGNTVSDTSRFSTDPQFSGLADGTLLRTATISDRKPVSRDTVIPIYGDEEILVQGAGKTLGERTINVSLTAKTNDVLVPNALSFASGFAPDADYSFLVRQTTTENILKQTVQAVLAYNYFNE
jgi:hypothetical protein